MDERSVEMELDRGELERIARRRSAPHKIVQRARIIIMWMDGVPKKRIAEQLETTRPTVYKWIDRYETGGIDSLLSDAARPGRNPKLTKEKEMEIVETTLTSKPKNATRWSVRTIALETGVSRMTAHRVWKKYDLKPHRTKAFKISNDPQFADKVRDIVGLYMNPPEKAIVFSVDEKSQIQALDRTQPSLPMKPGKCGTITHDYKRNGTTTLFAALNTLNGIVIGDRMKKHRSEEFIGFLNRINRNTSKKLEVHLILDNYGTHKTKKVEEWLLKHPRFHFHFTPTSSSWLNTVEMFFSHITKKRLKGGVFKSVNELNAAIMESSITTMKSPSSLRG